MYNKIRICLFILTLTQTCVNVDAQIGETVSELKEALKENTIRQTCNGLVPVYQNKIVELKKNLELNAEDIVQINRLCDLYITRCKDYLQFQLGDKLLTAFNSAEVRDETEVFVSIAKWMQIIHKHMLKQLQGRKIDSRKVYDFLYPLLIDEKSGAQRPRKWPVVIWKGLSAVDVKDILNPRINSMLKKSLEKSNIVSLSQKEALKDGKGLCKVLHNENFRYIYYGTLSLFKYFKDHQLVKQIIEGGINERVANLYEFLMIYKVCKYLRNDVLNDLRPQGITEM